MIFYTHVIDFYHIFEPLMIRTTDFHSYEMRYAIWYSRLLAFCHFMCSAIDNTESAIIDVRFWHRRPSVLGLEFWHLKRGDLLHRVTR